MEELVELEDVGVIHLPENGDLVEQLLLLLIFQILLVDDLDCSERLGVSVLTLPDFTISPYRWLAL